MALEGNARDFGLSEIFQLIAIQKKSGMLSVSGDKNMAIFFQDGFIVSTRDRRTKTRDPLKDYLLNYGFIGRDEMNNLQQIQARSGMDLSDILLQEKYFSDDELNTIFTDQIYETIQEVLSWPKSYYKFVTGSGVLVGVRTFSALKVEGLLMESMRRIDEYPEMMPLLAEQVAASPMLDGPPMLLFPVSTVQRIFEFAGAGMPEMDPIEAIQYAPLAISLEMQVTTRTITAPNVLARLPGAQSANLDEVVLTAHFDHEPPGQPNAEGDSIYNGADDNASGTAALLETARILSRRAAADVRTIVFVAFTAEELGLIGSDHYVKDPSVANDSTYAMLNFDMVGRLRENKLVTGGTGSAPEFPQLLT